VCVDPPSVYMPFTVAFIGADPIKPRYACKDEPSIDRSTDELFFWGEFDELDRSTVFSK
jgi:hypothetical protein